MLSATRAWTHKVHDSLTLQHVSRREDQLEGDAKLKLAVLAGQLVALREGLGNTLTLPRVCYVGPVLVPIAAHACPVTHGILPLKAESRSRASAKVLKPPHCCRSIQL